jgi:hypothetical protein
MDFRGSRNIFGYRHWYFLTPVPYNISPSGGGCIIESINVADLNGDNRLDILVCGSPNSKSLLAMATARLVTSPTLIESADQLSALWGALMAMVRWI